MNDARFAAMAGRLAALSPEDSLGLQNFRTELCNLRELFDRLRQSQLAEFVGAADAMVRNLGCLDADGFAQVKELVITLLQVVGDAFDELSHPGERPRAAVPASTPAPVPQEPLKRRPSTLSLNLAGDSSPERGLRAMSELLLGQILVEEGHVTRADIVAALKCQAVDGSRIGEALIALGRATPEVIELGLKRQEELYDQATDGRFGRSARLLQDLTLGEILLRIGGVKQSEMERGLQVQRATGRRLGETLVELGATTWERIEEAVRIQRTNRADSWTRDSAADRAGIGRLRLDS